MKYIKLLEGVDRNIHTGYSFYKCIHKYLRDYISRESARTDLVTIEFMAPLNIHFKNGWSLTISGGINPILYLDRGELSPIISHIPFSEDFHIFSSLELEFDITKKQSIEFCITYCKGTTSNSERWDEQLHLFYGLIGHRIEELNSRDEVWSLLENPEMDYLDFKKQLEYKARQLSEIDDYLY
jgi:hypothetical protein